LLPCTRFENDGNPDAAALQVRRPKAREASRTLNHKALKRKVALDAAFKRKNEINRKPVHISTAGNTYDKTEFIGPNINTKSASFFEHVATRIGRNRDARAA
jgi:hypothetical protein